MAKDTGKKLADMLYGANPDQAAFGVYPQLKPKRSKQDPEAAKNVPVDLARGFVSGVAGAPGDLESMFRLLPGLDESRTILPTSEDIEKRLPFKSDTPVSRAATGLGQLGGGFYTGPGSPFRLVGAIPGALKHGAEEFAKASAGSASHVIKPKGGNWLGGALMGNIDENIVRMKPYKKAGAPADWLKKDLAATEARLKMLEEDPYSLPQMVEGQKQSIENIKKKIAVNDWVTNNLGKYAKNLMGTPEDPVRLMFDKRTAEIEAKYAKDMERAERFAQRAMDEPDPRRQANFLREAERLKVEAATEREIAIDHVTHMPARLGEVDELADSSLKERRRAAGFPAEGMGQSEAARRWENLTDDAISSMRAGDIQASAGAMEESQAALQALRAKDAEIQQKFNEHVLSKGLGEKDLAAFNSLPMAEKAAIIQDTEYQALQKNYNNKRLEVSSPEYEAGLRNSWISKLDPEAQVYSGHASDAGFDHVIDVLKQDVAEGRIRPEQLNKVSVEQAVARAAEYDREMAEKMAAAQAKSMEAFPVHKEYPEGYKWIELKRPDTPLPEGYTEGVNDKFVFDPQGRDVQHPNITTLEEALKNEGEMMGHCVGGYCPDVLEGRSRIFSLRGPKGESHVTVETSPGSIREYESAANALSDDDLYKHGQLAKKLMAENKNLNYGDADQMAYQQLFGALPERIVQIKGKQNEAPVEKYLPFVQDFVKGGKWSEVGDLRNTGLLRYDTPEGVKYITKDEYSDMLLKELGAPPAEGMADGGPVYLSTNPDTMALELAGGGLVEKLAKLARAAPKTKQEIEAIAERLAPQVTGEYVRESAKSAKTVAGKTKKQFERERDLPVDIRATKEERIPQPIDIEKLKGEVMIGIPGDPTVTGKTLYSVGEHKLGSPSPQHGGPQYGLYHDDDHFWASGLGAARRVQNLAREAAQQYDAPVAGNYIMMGPESINYAQHFADANLQAIDLSKMTKRQIEGFDKLIRQGSPASGPRPSFPGIEDKESAYLHMAMDPELRKHFNDLMQKNTVTEAFNLPSGHDIRYAITEPALRDLETGVTGYSMGRMRPDIPASELKFSEHPTYSHDIPGHFLGQSPYPMPYELSFPDTLRAIRENPKQAPHEFGSLKMVGPRQIIDQQMIDEIKAYEERMKQLTGKKKGGKVQKNEQAVQNPVHFTENPDAMRLAMTKRN